MAKVRQYVLGLEDLRKEFAQLPNRLGLAVGRRGLLAGANVVREDARRRVRKRSGELAKHIVSSTRRVRGEKKGQPRQYLAVVNIKRGSAKILVLRRGVQERDSAGRFTQKTADNTREIVANPRRYAHLVELGTRHSPAYPFMRPAMDTNKDAILKAVTEKTRTELAKELAKVKAKQAARKRA